MMAYDKDWTPRPDYVVFNSEYREDRIIDAPQGYERMLNVAYSLSQVFPVVRVDLYNINGKTYFGEMTFTGSGGMMDHFSDAFQYGLGAKVKI